MDGNKEMEMRDLTRLFEETGGVLSGDGADRKNESIGVGSCGACRCAEACVPALAYPGLEGIGEDAAALKIVSSAYAGDEGELKAVLQYVYQHILFENMGFGEYAEILRGIAVEEMKHLEILGRLILKLGAPPVYSYLPPYPINYFSARAVSYSRNPQKMILDDIAAEQYAIDSYTKMLRLLKNEQAAAVVQRIRMDEEAHLSAFKCIFEKLTAK